MVEMTRSLIINNRILGWLRHLRYRKFRIRGFYVHLLNITEFGCKYQTIYCLKINLIVVRSNIPTCFFWTGLQDYRIYRIKTNTNHCLIKHGQDYRIYRINTSGSGLTFRHVVFWTGLQDLLDK